MIAHSCALYVLPALFSLLFALRENRGESLILSETNCHCKNMMHIVSCPDVRCVVDPSQPQRIVPGSGCLAAKFCNTCLPRCHFIMTFCTNYDRRRATNSQRVLEFQIQDLARKACGQCSHTLEGFPAAAAPADHSDVNLRVGEYLERPVTALLDNQTRNERSIVSL